MTQARIRSRQASPHGVTRTAITRRACADWPDQTDAALADLADRASDQAHATVTLEHEALSRLNLQEVAFDEAVHQGLIGVEGDPASVARLLGLLDDVSPTFEIVWPKPEP
jgi:alkyl sulfatase BDS1-like metallo-beta-lactamase superfamily hydrolase